MHVRATLALWWFIAARFVDDAGPQIFQSQGLNTANVIPPVPSALPRHIQIRISFTILTQADWCAARTAARREAGLLPVVGTLGAGTRVIW